MKTINNHKCLESNRKINYLFWSLIAICLVPLETWTQISPKLESLTSTEGQAAILGNSNTIGQIFADPTDSESIGVIGRGYTGVMGTAFSNLGYGVYGTTGKESGGGVYGLSTGEFSIGVIGEAMGSATTGVKGTTNTDFGYGVHGVGIGNDVRGVFGVCANGSTGHSGYFFGGKGVYINNNLGVRNTDPGHPIQVGTAGGPFSNGNGAHVTLGGVWTNGSSRAFKENFQAVNAQDVLEQLMSLSIERWNYVGSDEGERLGPMAEDFYEVFGLGNTDKYISTTDADGVALAAIQGLYELSKNQVALIQNLSDRIKSLENTKRKTRSK